jgi:hypothetical protein
MAVNYFLNALSGFIELARDASIRRQGSVNPGKARSFRGIQ